MTKDTETLKALYKTLKATQKKLHKLENGHREPIAIIGMGCRFPGGANTIGRFRELLARGGDGIIEVPPTRWDGRQYYDPDPEAPGKVTTNRAGFLQEPVDGFDSAFFHLSPKEVQSIDPQQRLLLEVCWEAFENAGLDITILKGSKTGVFCGIANSDYGIAHLRSGEPEKIDGYSVTGTALSAAVGRISYLFGFEGPNMAIDTACSSSLVAVHLACQSLHSGESDIAVAAGINLILTPEGHIGFSKLRALSPDGRCKSFADSADGYGRGEGCGLVILKRLSEAERAGDMISAVIRGTAVNQDGRTNGFTAPSTIAQEKVLAVALENSGLGAEEIGYLEAHGTGTPLGDPIEMAAIGKVYGGADREGRPLYVGSAKANIGHLEAAAGIAGLIKAALTLEGGWIFPQINFSKPNHHIPWEQIPVRIPLELTAWPEGAGRRAAAVSSFGFSGTNGHAILQERPPLITGPREVERSHHLLNLSAPTGAGLRELAARYQRYLADAEAEVGDICYTAAVGRCHFPKRLAVVGKNKAELHRELAGFMAADNAAGAGSPPRREIGDPRIVMLFTGQGSQYHKMGLDLYQSQPLFRATLDLCAELLSPHLDCSLVALLYGEDDQQARIHETRYTQPVIFAVEYGLAKLLESWGIRPALVVGHSIGEYVAACLAGVFSLAEAIALVAARGRLMQSLPAAGGMAVVGAGEQLVRQALEPYRDKVSLAAVNGPKNTVISGEKEAVAAICAGLKKEGIVTHPLQVSHAFHSCLMDPILDEFRGLAGAIHYAPPTLPIMANVTGMAGGPEMAGPDYWVEQMRRPVRFADCMRAIGAEGYEVFIEVGGTSTLTNLGRQCLPGHKGLWLSTLGRRDLRANLQPGRVEGVSDWQSMLQVPAGLYTNGLDLDWEGFDRPYSRKRVLLPNYPFQRTRQWLDFPGPRRKSPALDAAQAGAMYEKLNRLSRFSVLRVFKEGGVFLTSGERYRLPELQERIGLIPDYQQLCNLLLAVLENGGFIALAGDEITSLAPVAEWGIPEITEAVGEMQREITQEYAGIGPVAVSFARCMEKYLAVLTGRIGYAEVLFPQGAMDLVDNLYSNNEIQAFFNRLLAEQVRELVIAHGAESSAKPWRIIEIGAGMGSVTGHVLPMLDGLGDLIYCYSDIGPAFIEHGAERFGVAYPWVTFSLLNIEADLAAQGFVPGSWDLVIASNVLHATGRIDHTLSQVRQLLKPGGALIINEVTKFQDIVGVIFGLTNGWWLFEDPDCRLAGGPSLSLAGWQEGLTAAGFSLEKQVGLPGDLADKPMQCVILAKNDGGGEMDRMSSAEPGGLSVSADGGGRMPVGSGRRAEILAEVGRLMYQAAEIEISGPDRDRNLFELGFASLMIARLKDLLKRTYGVDLQMSWFYSRTDTFNKIVDFIEAELVEAGDLAVPAADAVVAARSPGSIGGGVDSPIGRQLELMGRQLQAMAAQLGLRPEPPLPDPDHGRGKGVEEGKAGSAEAANRGAEKTEYVAYRGVTGREKLELNVRQQEHLRKLIGRYTGLTPGSKERTGTYRPVFANTRNIAGFRPEWKEMIYQIIVERAAGSHFTDIDGRDYLDVSMGFGVYLFGHNPPFVQAALQQELRQGTPIGPMSDRAGKVATLIHELAGVERVAFFNTGTEAVMAAVRIARTVTGRQKIVLFSSSYHGHFDGVLAVKDYDGPMGRAVVMAPGTVPAMVQDVYVLDYGTEEALQFIELHGRELAAVLVEPVQSRKPELQPTAFLKQLREITTATGAALIFDEMIIGFRVHPGGGQGWFGIQADIVTYGKVVGGGLPIGVVAGKAHYLDAVDGGMWHYGDGSFPERENTFIAGTFNHHPLAMAGAYEVLNHLKQAGPSLQENLNARTGRLAARLNNYFEAERLPIKMNHFGSLFRIPLKGDQELLYYHLLSRGIYIWEGRNCFLSTAHTDGDLDYFVASVQESIEEMRAGGLFGRDQAPAPAGRNAAARQTFLPMSSAQKRLYVLSGLDGGELAYHIVFALDVLGGIDPDNIERCFQTIVDRHESLRTGFAMADDNFVQQVHEKVAFTILAEEGSPDDIEAIVRDFVRPFDLARPPLIRVGLVRFAAHHHFLIVDAHHLIFDGISVNVFMSEFITLLQGENLPSSPPPRYRDYVEMERQYFAGEQYLQHQGYWLAKFAGDIPPLDLPADYARPGLQTFKGRKIFRKLAGEETLKLKGFARSAGASLHMTLLAAYFLLLRKLTGNEDIVVGTTYDGRGDEEFRDAVGMFTNTVPIRCRPDGGKTFRALLDEVKSEVLEAYDRSDFPFEHLVEKLALVRDMGRNPLFDTMFVYETQDNSSVTVGEVTLAEHNCSAGSAIFDLTLDIVDYGRELNISLEYSTDLFRAGTAERYLQYFLNILAGITAEPTQQLSAIEFISAAEKRQLLHDFNATARPYRKEMLIAGLFEEQVARTPGNLALRCGKVRLTYRQLNEKANKVAHYLRDHYEVGPDDIVGVMLERSEWMMVAIFGILKAGAAYMPIEPSLPAERVHFMVADSGCRVVLTDGARPAGIEAIDVRKVKHAGKDNLPQTAGSDNLAYVLYTSGSTGQPKGVMIEQRSVVNRIEWMQHRYPLDGSEVILQKTPFTFDVSVWELFWWSWYGASVCFLEPGGHKDPAVIAAAVHSCGVTKIHFVPSMLSVFLNYLAEDPEQRLGQVASLKQVFASGEALRPNQVELFNRLRRDSPGMTLHNLYGPTEATVDVSYYDCPIGEVGKVVVIGKPIDNTALYILDRQYGNLLPIGVPGELCIGGAGLARGYLNNPALTAAKFVPLSCHDGRIVYRTGDLCRWLADGNVEYLGRLDHQVKIRGYRIELGEIENVLAGHPAIAQAEVIDREGEGGDRFLCAYLVASEDLEVGALRSFLGHKLPDYMIPARFFQIDKMPLTANGKVDRKALAAMEGAEVRHDTEFGGPKNVTEALLVEIWQGVLGREKIGVFDNYFALGGDSIKAIQILSRLGRQNLKLEIRDIFATPTIRALAPKIVARGRIPDQGPVSGPVLPTPIQARFFREQDGDLNHYSQALLLRCQDPVDEVPLRTALQALQNHHDALRLTSRRDGESVGLEIAGPGYPLVLTVADLRGRADGESELARMAAEVPATLDPASGPVMKAVLFRLDDGDRILIVIHHLAVDGVSWRILLEDLQSGYDQALAGENIALPLKTDSGQLWATEISRAGSSPNLLAEIPYWQKIVATTALAIPPDFAPGPNLYKDLGTVSAELDGEETRMLMTEAHRAYHTETVDLLLVALARALAKVAGVKRGFLEVEGHGRESLATDIDIGRTVGWFTSIYPVGLDLVDSDDLGAQIKEIKEDLRRIPNKGAGYGILKYLRPEGEAEIGPRQPARIIFNYLGSFGGGDDGRFVIDGKPVGQVIGGQMIRPAEIEIEGVVLANRLKLSVGYNRQLHQEKTIANFLEIYLAELRQVIGHCLARQVAELTPHDLTYKELTGPELAALLDECGVSSANLKDIYPLSPLQEGMLFHAMLADGSAAYTMQISFGIEGNLDLALFESAWNLLLARHDILRTVFVHKGLERPLQVCSQAGEIDFRREDLRALSPDEQQHRLAEFKAQDRAEGFALSDRVPMRLTVFLTGAKSYTVFWTYHHILIDGWCAGILINELFTAYSAYLNGEVPEMTPAPPYSAYIGWLECLDRTGGLDYWRDYLAGYDRPASLPRDYVGDQEKSFRPETVILEIDEQTTGNLKSFASEIQVTLNTIFQTGWGVVLERYSGAEEVVFGATVSGRPAEVAEIENMVGLFINTIPVRMKMSPEKTVGQLLREVQDDALPGQTHSYCSLAEIQAATELKQDLLDHVLVFENYPLAEELTSLEKQYRLGFNLGQVEVFEQTNYDLVLVVEPGATIRVEFRYNAEVFSRERMAGVKKLFGTIITALAGGAEMTIAELRQSLLSGDEKREQDSFIRAAMAISEDF